MSREELLRRSAHVAALWGLAATLPLFDLLGSHPEFFSTRGLPARDIVVFALGVALVPPVLLIGLEWLASLVSRPLAWSLQLAYVVSLVAAIAMQVVPVDAWIPGVAIGLVAGGGAALAYARAKAARSALTVLAPAPLVFAGLFLLVSDVSPMVLGGSGDAQAAGGTPSAPIVIVVFDELPVHSLMAGDGGVDAVHYPNFARLAGDATWYRNTASVDQDTPYAVPAILDGRIPRQERLPVAADHPQNLFSLLAGRYELHVREDATAICAPRLCAERAREGFGPRLRSLFDDAGLVYAHQVLPDDLERDLPAVSRNWRRFEATSDPTAAVAATRRVRRESKLHRFRRLHRNLAGGRRRRFEDFVAGIAGGSQPRLHFIHILLPHVPFQYLPSGRRYRRTPTEGLAGLDNRPGYDIPFLVGQSYQRHLLQLEATDRLLGELLDRLHDVGIYDRALVAVVADHGMSFRLGHDHRLVRAANVEDIAPVPFFLKAPGQRRGRISDKPLRTIDVLPTLADVLDFSIPWHVDGRSARAPTAAAQRRRHIIAKRFRHVYLVDTPAYERDKRAALARKLRLFGDHSETYGPRPELIGRRLAELSLSPADSELAEVEEEQADVPAHLVGRIVPARRGGGRILVLALAGRVAVTGRTFTLAGADDEQFSLLVPERVLSRGPGRFALLSCGLSASSSCSRLRVARRSP